LKEETTIRTYADELEQEQMLENHPEAVKSLGGFIDKLENH